MTIWSFGALYGSSRGDVSDDFIKNGVACIKYEESEAPEMFEMLKSIQVGDLIYIKSFGPNSKSITVKGVGIVTNNDIVRVSRKLGHGIEVRWVYNGEFNIDWSDIDDRLRHPRHGTIYREFNPDIHETIIDMLTDPLHDYYHEEDEEDQEEEEIPIRRQLRLAR